MASWFNPLKTEERQRGAWMRPVSGQDLQGEEVEVIEILSSDDEDDYGKPPPVPAAAGPARAATPTEVAAPDDGDGEGPEEHGEAVDSRDRAAAAAAPSPPAAHAPRPQQQKARQAGGRRRGAAKRKREEQWAEEEQPASGRLTPAIAGPSGAGRSPCSPGGGHQRSLNEFYPVVRSPTRGTAPKPPQEDATAGPAEPAATPAAAALQPPNFSSLGSAFAFQVAGDILGGLMVDREGGGAGAVSEVLAALLRRFRGAVPLGAAIPQDMFDERKQELIDEMMGSHMAAELRAAKEALAAKEAALEEAEGAGAALAGELDGELTAARAELEEWKARALRAGELEQGLAAARAELETAQAGASQAAKLKESLLVMRGETRAAERRARVAERALAAAREELRGMEEAEKARATAASGSCGVPTPSGAGAEGPHDGGNDDAAAAEAKAAPPPPLPPLRAADFPKDVISQSVLGLNNLATIVWSSVEASRDSHALSEAPHRLKARLDAAWKLINTAGKAALVETNVWAEGVDAAARWPGFSYSPRSHWAGVEVPVLGSQLYECLRKAGLNPMEPGLRSVLGGAVAYPILVSLSLIDGGKGWGLRALGPIPTGSCIIAYHGEYMTAKEADEVKNATQGRSANSCFSFTLQACAARAAARTPEQRVTIVRGGAPGPFRNLRSCVLDSRRRGNASRFFNHSCVPNCTSHEVDVPYGPTMTMHFALRDIQAGEELTLDYAQGWSPKDMQKALEAYRKGNEHRKCYCGHVKCREWCF